MLRPWPPLVFIVSMVGVVLLGPACFDPKLGPTALACGVSADCPDGLGCFESRCIAANDCVDDDGAALVARADGAACATGVCIAGVCQVPGCGDGVITGDERCDGEVGCRADCTRCGDDVIDDGEDCDDGDNNSDVRAGACRSDCVFAHCGDGVRDPGEGCDEGDGNSDVAVDGCRSTCARASCGDGVQDDGEDCDDGEGNSDVAVDGCRSTCVLGSCGDGVVDTGEACDDGVANSDTQPDACRSTCVPARCGDGTRDVGEGCDDGDSNSDSVADACRTSCVRSSCGDGVVDSDEVCDGQADCSVDCLKVSACGDGVVDVGEDCDDENDNDFDGCDHCVASPWSATLLNRVTPDGPEPLASFLSPSAVFAQRTTRRLVVASGCRILEFTSEIMVPIAGSPTCREFSEAVAADGSAAAGGRFRTISSVAVDVNQNVYFIEQGTQFVRRVGLDGRLSTVRVIQGEHHGGMTADETGRVWWTEGSAVVRMDVDGSVAVVAGAINSSGNSGNGGVGTSARFNRPSALAVGPNGDVLIGDQLNTGLRTLRADGVVVATQAFTTSVRAVAVTDSGLRIAAAENRIFEITDAAPRSLFGNGSIDPMREGGPAAGGAVRPTSLTAVGETLIMAELNYLRRLSPAETPIIASRFANFAPPDGGFASETLATGTVISSGPRIAFDAQGRLLAIDELRSLTRVEAGIAQRVLETIQLRPTLISSRNGKTVIGPGCVVIDDATGTQTPTAGCAVSDGPRAIAQDSRGGIYFSDFFGAPARAIRRLDPNGSVTRVAGAGFGDPVIDGPALNSPFLGPVAFSVMPDDTLVFAEFGSGVMHIDSDGVLRLLSSLTGVTHTVVTADGAIYAATISQVFRINGDGSATAVSASFSIDDGLGLGQPALSHSLSPIVSMATDGERLCTAGQVDGKSVIRCFVPGGTLEPALGAMDPENLGPIDRAHVPGLHALLPTGTQTVLGATGPVGRVLRLDRDPDPTRGTFIDVSVGVPDGDAALAPRFQPLISDVAAFAPSANGDRLFVADALGPAPDPFDFDPPPRHGTILAYALDAQGTPSQSLPLPALDLKSPSGVAVVDDDIIAVSDNDRHTVSLIDVSTGARSVIVGIDGIAGRGIANDSPGTRVLLSSPGALAVADNGDLYIADVGNNQVLRRTPDGAVRRILGDADGNGGTASGARASQTPLSTPGQLALDRQGNLYVAAARSARVVYADEGGAIDGDGRSDVVFSADGNDSLGAIDDVTRCISGVAVVDDHTVWLSDACVGALIELRRP